MWNWGAVFDDLDRQAGRLQGGDRTFAAAARALDPDFALTHPKLHSLFTGLLSRTLAGEWGAFATALETRGACGTPAQSVAFEIRDRHDRVVKSRVDVNHTDGYIATNLSFLGFGHCWQLLRRVTTDSDVSLKGAAIRPALEPAALRLGARKLAKILNTLLTGDGLARTLPGTGIGLGSLATNR